MPKRYLVVATLTVILVAGIAAVKSDPRTDRQPGSSSPVPAQLVNGSGSENTVNGITRLSEKFVGGNSACNPRIVVCE